ncbi:MAG TPA: NADH-quinone oxidoreductase subunit NuoE [Ktedonobacterales bacterium]|nr:NADH-quinone oxidoreductase subunit NuoE [Ktedonobacterales bacterium]
MITDDVKARMLATLAQYPSKRSAMLPCLHIVQEAEGYVTREGILTVAEVIGVKPDEVESVVTFYSMYTQEPLGTHVVKVCSSISCYLRGCDALLAHLEGRLGVHKGETTPDGRFTLESVECLAACGMAPVMQVDGRFVENATPETADAVVEYLARGNDAEGIDSRWRMISDGAGMATETTIGAKPDAADAEHQREEAR